MSHISLTKGTASLVAMAFASIAIALLFGASRFGNSIPFSSGVEEKDGELVRPLPQAPNKQIGAANQARWLLFEGNSKADDKRILHDAIDFHGFLEILESRDDLQDKEKLQLCMNFLPIECGGETSKSKSKGKGSKGGGKSKSKGGKGKSGTSGKGKSSKGKGSSSKSSHGKGKNGSKGGKENSSKSLQGKGKSGSKGGKESSSKSSQGKGKSGANGGKGSDSKSSQGKSGANYGKGSNSNTSDGMDSISNDDPGYGKGRGSGKGGTKSGSKNRSKGKLGKKTKPYGRLLYSRELNSKYEQLESCLDLFFVCSNDESGGDCRQNEINHLIKVCNEKNLKRFDQQHLKRNLNIDQLTSMPDMSLLFSGE